MSDEYIYGSKTPEELDAWIEDFEIDNPSFCDIVELFKEMAGQIKNLQRHVNMLETRIAGLDSRTAGIIRLGSGYRP